MGGCGGAEHRGLVVKVSGVVRPIDQVTRSSVGKSGSSVDSRRGSGVESGFGEEGLKVTAYNQSDERIGREDGWVMESLKVTKTKLRKERVRIEGGDLSKGKLNRMKVTRPNQVAAPLAIPNAVPPISSPPREVGPEGEDNAAEGDVEGMAKDEVRSLRGTSNIWKVAAIKKAKRRREDEREANGGVSAKAQASA